MLRFPYLEEPLIGSAPPPLTTGTTSRWRPLVPVRIIGPTGRSRLFLRGLLDPGSDDTIFPLDVATLIGSQLRTKTKHSVRWRGQRHGLEFGDVEIELAGAAETLRWPAVVGFSDAPIRYPLLGIAGRPQCMDVTFLGEQRAVSIETNASYPGSTT